MDPVLAALATETAPFALATVVSTWSSAPRGVGARMLVREDGSTLGSVSGGCVEADVHALALQVLRGAPAVLQRYGVSDGDALAVGLMCGGTIEVLVQRITDPEPLRAFAASVAAHHPVAIASVLTGEHAGSLLEVTAEGESLGGTGFARLDGSLVADARAVLATGRTTELSYGTDGSRQGVGVRVLVDVVAPPPRLIVAGVTDFAVAIAELGGYLGFRVTVCDARSTFATRERFGRADEIVIEWPHRYLAAEIEAGRVDARTVLLVCSHDPKFDEPVLEAALPAGLGFVGAMGSRRTHSQRLERLRERGISDEALASLRSPVGLDLGGRSPRETALSILAEVVAASGGGTGRPLADLGGPLHGERSDA
ncbi:XdhC family protein [Pseudactinotalea suaedae]|uniref:XdhC family protein n=1 Tax=Pseudactinotalea suaedae TaxID=1524924 RepID=UPI0012E0FCBE|nr:XdhC/CoxI family protein [Pseudactinotalea suaedae]